MNRKMGFRWNLRKLMAERGMFATSDLVPLLAERGVHLSREQVYRLRHAAAAAAVDGRARGGLRHPGLHAGGPYRGRGRQCPGPQGRRRPRPDAPRPRGARSSGGPVMSAPPAVHARQRCWSARRPRSRARFPAWMRAAPVSW